MKGGNQRDYPEYPEYEEQFDENPARFLYVGSVTDRPKEDDYGTHQYGSSPLLMPLAVIRGIQDIERLDAWLDVETDLGPRKHIIAAINKRKAQLEADDNQGDSRTTVRASDNSQTGASIKARRLEGSKRQERTNRTPTARRSSGEGRKLATPSFLTVRHKRCPRLEQQRCAWRDTRFNNTADMDTIDTTERFDEEESVRRRKHPRGYQHESGLIATRQADGGALPHLSRGKDAFITTLYWYHSNTIHSCRLKGRQQNGISLIPPSFIGGGVRV